MADELKIDDGLAIPLAEIELRTSRSSGPGGQHANVTASRVEAVFDVEARIFGDTGVVTAKTKGFRREGGRDVPNRVRYIRVYARRSGE